MFTKEHLKKQIQALGITPTDNVLIHSSMKAIGETENGADGLIDAFCEYLTDGLFIVPTHTWNNVTRTQPIFDVNKTVPCIGIIPTVAAFRKDGIRSLHPTHSIWVHGKNAADFIRGEEKQTTPASPTSCWARLVDIKTKILLIGVGNDKNTFIHSVDELIDLPDRLAEIPFDTTIIDYDGNTIHGSMVNHACSHCETVSAYYTNFDKAFNEMGVQHFGMIGNAETRVVDAALCREIVYRIYSRIGGDVTIQTMDIPEEAYRH
ncbi:MAG: AAC(3) family N-acetyltransferase [Ruminococcaceae bacterium]|nr:AAC(3) family N-acetyltransferase [Oscillospiraceae bacterium]